MGEAKRRRENKRKAEQLLASLQTIDNEAAGVWSLDIVYHPEGLAELAMQGLADKTAEQKFTLLEGGIFNLNAATLCLLCPHRIGEAKVGACVLACAQIDEPTGAIVNFVCVDCAADTATLIERVIQAYKNHHLFGDDMRVVPTVMVHPAGRA